MGALGAGAGEECLGPKGQTANRWSALVKLYSEVLGEQVEVPDEPSRIVSLAPSITETLYLLGVWDRVVGVSFFCSKPPQAREKPRVGAYLNVNYKLLEELKPDLVLTTTGAQLRVTKELREKGYTVYPIPLPTSLYGILDNVVAVGYVIGRVEEARSLATRLAARLAAIAEEEVKARVYYEVDLGGPVTVGSLTYIDHSLRHIGLENIFSRARRTYFEPDFDEVAREDPDVIVYEPKPFTTMTFEKLLEMFRKRGWERMRAVREKMIILLEPDSLAHYGPSHVDTLAELKERAEKLLGGVLMA